MGTCVKCKKEFEITIPFKSLFPFLDNKLFKDAGELCESCADEEIDAYGEMRRKTQMVKEDY